MNIYLKQVAPLGFVGCDMYTSAAWQSMYRRIDHANRTVTAVTNHIPYDNTVERWKLTKVQFKLFMAGKLALVPLGCCSPCSKLVHDTPDILFKGKIRSRKHLLSILCTP